MTDTVSVLDVRPELAHERQREVDRNRGDRGRASEYVLNATLAVALLLFILPILLVAALAVYFNDGGPIFFGHRRIGRNGKSFPCFKLRSMATDAEARLADLLANDPDARAEWDRDHKLRNDPRVTPIGNFLRRSSLDELPQLVNVLRGEMNLVGPRPIVDAERPKYGHRFSSYCSVKPGITGLWQVSGRNDVSYRSRVAMDACYAKMRNPALDLYILIMTIPCVLKAKGCY